MQALSIVAGLALVLLALLDVFLSVIVPRATRMRLRPTRYLTRYLWRAWKRFAPVFAEGDKREDYLGSFAPFLLVAFLVMWVVMLIVGYGLIFYGLRDQIKPVPNLSESIYFSGSSLITIGFGDFAPTGIAARALAVVAGATGLGAFAIVTAFLFPVIGAYQEREAFVVLFTNRAGAPPSGIDLIELHVRGGIVDGLAQTMRDAEIWLAHLLETHLAYPILTYFRSTHDDISWIAVVGTVLDASTLASTTLDAQEANAARIVNRLARHFVRDFSKYYGFTGGDAAGIDRPDFDAAYDRLRDADLTLRDRETAWRDFMAVRATYAPQLEQIADYWAIPPSQWFADRSLMPHQGALDIEGSSGDGATR